MWILVFVGALLIAMGFSVHVLKWYFLISGYNTMPKEKQANVDTEGLGRLIGLFAYFNGGGFIAAGLLTTAGVKWALTPVIIFFIASTVYMIIKAQTFDGNVYDQKSGRLQPNAWKQFIVPGIVLLATAIFVMILMLSSSKPIELTFLDEGLQIHGMYGEVYPWASIESIELRDNLPTIERRTNGSAVGSKLRGHFRTRELGSVKLFVDTAKPPFLYLETTDGVTILNSRTEEETTTLFEEILTQIKP